MSPQQTVNSAGAVTTFTDHVSRCHGCWLDFRVSAEAIAHTRTADGPEAAGDSDAEVANRIDYCLLCAREVVAVGEKLLEDDWKSRFRYYVRPDDSGSWSVFYDDPEADLTSLHVWGHLPGERAAREYAEVISGTWRFCPPAHVWLTLHHGSLWSAETASSGTEPDLEDVERFIPADDQSRFWIHATWPDEHLDLEPGAAATPTAEDAVPPEEGALPRPPSMLRVAHTLLNRAERVVVDALVRHAPQAAARVREHCAGLAAETPGHGTAAATLAMAIRYLDRRRADPEDLDLAAPVATDPASVLLWNLMEREIIEVLATMERHAAPALVDVLARLAARHRARYVQSGSAADEIAYLDYLRAVTLLEACARLAYDPPLAETASTPRAPI